MIQIKDFSFCYGKKKILYDINIKSPYGSLNSLIGINGAGKSTLFACLSKQNNSMCKTIFVNNKDINQYSYREYAKIVSFVPQFSLINRVDSIVRDFLVEARTPYLPLFSVPGRKEYDFVEKIANKVGVTHLLSENFSKLSGGQQQMLLLTRALVQDTPIILLDEPMSALDLRNQALLLNLIKNLSRQGKTILFSTHNPNHALWLNCDVLLLQKGTIICQGSADVCLSNETLQKIYGDNVETIRFKNKKIVSLKVF